MDWESNRSQGKHWDTMGYEIEAFQTQLRVRLKESRGGSGCWVQIHCVLSHRVGRADQPYSAGLAQGAWRRIPDVSVSWSDSACEAAISDYVVAVTLEVAAEHRSNAKVCG